MQPIDFLLRSARKHPDKIALSGPQGELSYGSLLRQVSALAAGLQALAPDPRARVAICGGNDITHVVALLATLMAGRIWVPLNPRSGRDELVRIIEFTEAAIVIAEAGLAGKVADTGVRTLVYAADVATAAMDTADANAAKGCELLRLCRQYEGGRLVPSWPDLADIQAIKFTGGTTGAPKGVMQSYRTWNTTIVSIMHAMRLSAHERYLAVASITHGTSTFLLPVLGCGGTVVLPISTRPRDVLDVLERERITAVFMPPTLIYSLLEDDTVRSRDWSALRHFVYSAAPMRVDKIREAQEVFGAMETSYGQTEAPAIIAYLSAEDARDPRNLQSVGRPSLMTEVAIMNPDGELLPPGETGEIVVRGDLLMSGYWRQPEKTAETLVDGWLRTGDGGYLDERGYLFLKDRMRDMIITGGFNVYPTDVENVLGLHEAVYDCAVFGVDDAKWGEAVHAAVQLREGATASAEELMAWVKTRLDAVKTPKAVHFFATLARTANGKVDKKTIKQHVEQTLRENRT